MDERQWCGAGLLALGLLVVGCAPEDEGPPREAPCESAPCAPAQGEADAAQGGADAAQDTLETGDAAAGGATADAAAPPDDAPAPADDAPAPADDASAPPEDADPVQDRGDAPAAERPRRDGVSFATDASERRLGVRIRDRQRTHPAIIYSVRLRDLDADERLRLRGEVALSRCNRKDIAGESGDADQTPCTSRQMRQSPYGYAPRFAAAFVLGDGPDDAGGRRVGPWRDTLCWEEKHHCALALPEVEVDDVPAGGDRWVHLVVAADANGHPAREWHVMEVEQGKGRLAVTRLGRDAARVANERTERLRSRGSMGVDQTEDEGDDTQVKRLVFSQRLDGLRAGDVVSADARMRAVLGRYDCHPLITSQIFLTRREDARDPQSAVKVLTQKNGFNCTVHGGDGCVYEKSGAAEVPRGEGGTLYVNYVATALRSCAAPNGGDRWEIRGGFLSVAVHR